MQSVRHSRHHGGNATLDKMFTWLVWLYGASLNEFSDLEKCIFLVFFLPKWYLLTSSIIDHTFNSNNKQLQYLVVCTPTKSFKNKYGIVRMVLDYTPQCCLHLLWVLCLGSPTDDCNIQAFSSKGRHLNLQKWWQSKLASLKAHTWTLSSTDSRQGIAPCWYIGHIVFIFMYRSLGNAPGAMTRPQPGPSEISTSSSTVANLLRPR